MRGRQGRRGCTLREGGGEVFKAQSRSFASKLNVEIDEKYKLQSPMKHDEPACIQSL